MKNLCSETLSSEVGPVERLGKIPLCQYSKVNLVFYQQMCQNILGRQEEEITLQWLSSRNLPAQS